MARTFKLMLAVSSAAAIVALGASHAGAAEFHCSVAPCKVTLKPDGTAGSKTSHHVIDFGVNGVISTVTCNQLTGEGTIASKTASSFTVGISYDSCNVAGQPATIDSSGCSYTFFSKGSFGLTCELLKPLQITFGTCTVSFSSEEFFGAVIYSNIGAEFNTTTEMTVNPSASLIIGSASAGCPGGSGSFIDGRYTTGNTIVTGETSGGTMANLWFF